VLIQRLVALKMLWSCKGIFFLTAQLQNNIFKFTVNFLPKQHVTKWNLGLLECENTYLENKQTTNGQLEHKHMSFIK